MRNSAGELAERFHLLALAELVLRLRQFGGALVDQSAKLKLGFLGQRDVVGDADEADRPTIAVLARFGLAAHPPPLAIGAAEASGCFERLARGNPRGIFRDQLRGIFGMDRAVPILFANIGLGKSEEVDERLIDEVAAAVGAGDPHRCRRGVGDAAKARLALPQGDLDGALLGEVLDDHDDPRHRAVRVEVGSVFGLGNKRTARRMVVARREPLLLARERQGQGILAPGISRLAHDRTDAVAEDRFARPLEPIADRLIAETIDLVGVAVSDHHRQGVGDAADGRGIEGQGGSAVHAVGHSSRIALARFARCERLTIPRSAMAGDCSDSPPLSRSLWISRFRYGRTRRKPCSSGRSPRACRSLRPARDRGR